MVPEGALLYSRVWQPFLTFSPLSRRRAHWPGVQLSLLFQRIGPSPWLSTFGLRAAFHQIPLGEADQDKTSFWWGQGKWRYKRMFYGMRNATAQFQRTIDHHLRERGLSEFAMAYVDDILVFSSTPEEHAAHIGRVLDMMYEVGLRVHPEKTIVGADVVEFLGHMVSAAGMQPTGM
jgi:hypothetical protein